MSGKYCSALQQRTVSKVPESKRALSMSPAWKQTAAFSAVLRMLRRARVRRACMPMRMGVESAQVGVQTHRYACCAVFWLSHGSNIGVSEAEKTTKRKGQSKLSQRAHMINSVHL